MSYTPTSWSTGDTITAAAMNKIENGIANAGATIITVPLTDTGVSYVSPSGSGDLSWNDIAAAFENGTIVRLVYESSNTPAITTHIVGIDYVNGYLFCVWQGSQIWGFNPITNATDPGIIFYYD